MKEVTEGDFKVVAVGEERVGLFCVIWTRVVTVGRMYVILDR